MSLVPASQMFDELLRSYTSAFAPGENGRPLPPLPHDVPPFADFLMPEACAMKSVPLTSGSTPIASTLSTDNPVEIGTQLDPPFADLKRGWSELSQMPPA